MSSPASGVVSTPTIYGKVDYGPTFGNVYRPLNPKRIIATAGASFPILPFDVIVIIQQASPGAFIIQLPDLRLWMSYPYGGFDLILKNRNFGFDMTVLPFGSQKIDGLSQLVASGGQGEGALVLSPLNDMSGWDTL